MACFADRGVVLTVLHLLPEFLVWVLEIFLGRVRASPRTHPCRQYVPAAGFADRFHCHSAVVARIRLLLLIFLGAFLVPIFSEFCWSLVLGIPLFRVLIVRVALLVVLGFLFF